MDFSTNGCADIRSTNRNISPEASLEKGSFNTKIRFIETCSNSYGSLLKDNQTNPFNSSLEDDMSYQMPTTCSFRPLLEDGLTNQKTGFDQLDFPLEQGSANQKTATDQLGSSIEETVNISNIPSVYILDNMRYILASLVPLPRHLVGKIQYNPFH